MKVALTHDFIASYGGAERVLEALHEIWPQAPVYTAFYKPEGLGPHKDKFKGWDIRVSWAQKIPFIDRLASPLRLLAPFMWNFDFSAFDVVISSTNMYFSNNLTTQPPAIYICYSHTPPRSLYGYSVSNPGILSSIYSFIFNPFLRFMDKKASLKVGYFIANSREVAARIKKFYGRDSIVINPPVSITPDIPISRCDNVACHPDIPGYYLIVSRLFPPKRVDLAIKVATKLGLRLKVVGRGSEEQKLRKIGGPTVEFLGEVDDKELSTLYSQCRAVLFLAKDEDFGIVPAESMMFGKPVIGAASGGVLETVIDGKTGILIDEPLTVEKVVNAIKKFEKTKFDSKTIASCAKKFSKNRFKKQILKFINEKSEIT